MSIRDNNFNSNQIKGIDLSVKSAAKKYPFIKGWEFSKDFEKYALHLYITLIVDYDEVAKFYKTEIHPSFSDRKYPLKSSLIFTFLKSNPMNWDSPEYKEFFNTSYNETQNIRATVNNVYQLLPDELSIFYTSENFNGSLYKGRVNLDVDNFADITVI